MKRRVRGKSERPAKLISNPEWTAATFGRAKPARDVLPTVLPVEVAGRLLRPRGRPRTGNARTSISLRLPPETLARWKSTGPGWQTRMVELLTRETPD